MLRCRISADCQQNMGSSNHDTSVRFLQVNFLKNTHRKKHPKIKLKRLQKMRISTFGSLVHQINSF